MEHPPGDRNGSQLDELRELIGLELQDILATAKTEGYERKDVLRALELALKAEQDGLAEAPAQLVEADVVTSA